LSITHAIQKIQQLLAIESSRVSSAEKVAATLGGMLGITLIAFISYQFTGMEGAAMIVPSMGAAAVLLFAVPHGKLSQPWPLFGGNLISAAIGVSCYQWIPDPFLAAGLSVGLAIGAMHLCNCIHPPGGATALAAVIGGPQLHELGYGYLLTPILINVIIIFIVAMAFNNLFPWRRYPTSMMRFSEAPISSQTEVTRSVDKQAIEQALQEMNLVIDVTNDELQRLFTLTQQHTSHQQMSSQQIILGHYYTNGKHGAEWAVRHIIDEHSSPKPELDMVIYRVAEGHGLKSASSCTRSEFAKWAVREVFANKR